MEEGPVCLVIGIETRDPDIIIKGLIGSEHPFSVHQNSNNQSVPLYTWYIDNKYYSASVSVCGISSSIDLNKQLADCTQAVIIYFDGEKAESLHHVESTWLPVLENCELLDVKILVCETCSSEEDDNRLNKIDVQKWCIKHGFEFVELDPTDKPDPEDDFPETIGMERIVQALHAHSWPNLELKEKGEKKSHEKFSEKLYKKTTADEESDEKVLDTISNDETSHPSAEGIDSFEELFQAMSLMKSQASGLQGDDRKAYAEKITMAFWRAINGDADEIAGLDSSDEEGQRPVA